MSDEAHTISITYFLLFPDLKGRGNDLSEAMVFHSTGAVDKGVNLDWICLSICQAFLGYVGFNDLTDNQGMAADRLSLAKKLGTSDHWYINAVGLE